MASEARLEATEHGLVPRSEGWFVVNAREAPWRHAEGRPATCSFEGEPRFAQLGIHVNVLAPGVPLSMYHWEGDQEGFLVLAGEAILVVEGEERRLRQWDFVHCPPGTGHAIVGAGAEPCVVVSVGARAASRPDDGAYTVDAAARRHGASVEEETTETEAAYAGLPARVHVRYRDGWLPG